MPAPDVLWHYTSADGLKGILTSGELWATDIRYLNDASEFRYAASIGEQILEQVQKRSPGSVASPVWSQYRKMLTSGYEAETYVFALSKVRDDLSQWRGYTPHGNGYAIGFEVPTLIPSLVKYGFGLAPCSYNPDEHVQLFTALFDDMSDKIEDWVKTNRSLSDAARDRFAVMLYSLTTIIAPQMKHRTFWREEEWRLASSVIDPPDERVEFRVGHSTLIPYYRLALDHDKPRIREILVGPTSHADLAGPAVRKLIGRSRIPVDRIESSEVPFRTL